MSERRVQEPDSMDRLMELQSRLRELTEAKKAKWRELGRPLPDSAAPGDSDPAPPESGQNGAGATSSESAGSPPVDTPVSAPAAASPPIETSAPVATSPQAPGTASASVAASAVTSEKTARRAPTTADDTSGPTDKRFARRRDTTAEWARGVRHRIGEARQFVGAFWRQAVGQVRDLTGGLGARHAKRKPRPGDPVTAEELIDDRSLGARLLGAAVFFVGLVAIGAVALVQLGKLEIPWLEDNALPAATATAGSGIEGASGTPLTGTPSAAPEGEDELEAGPDLEGSETATSVDAGPTLSEDSSPDLESEPSGDASGSEAGGSEAVAREVLEFTRLQGELAFLIGEYEIVRAAFESGDAGCEELNTHYSSIDSAHLLMSRVVARWREVPYRHVKAYEEISGLVDGTLRHYAASGCGLDPSELPDGE